MVTRSLWLLLLKCVGFYFKSEPKSTVRLSQLIQKHSKTLLYRAVIIIKRVFWRRIINRYQLINARDVPTIITSRKTLPAKRSCENKCYGDRIHLRQADLRQAGGQGLTRETILWISGSVDVYWPQAWFHSICLRILHHIIQRIVACRSAYQYYEWM